jgi:hypothetical protein
MLALMGQQAGQMPGMPHHQLAGQMPGMAHHQMAGQMQTQMMNSAGGSATCGSARGRASGGACPGCSAHRPWAGHSAGYTWPEAQDKATAAFVA